MKLCIFNRFSANYFYLSKLEACGDAPHVINEAFLFHPVFLSGHFKSVFETKYVHSRYT